ncbi:MAG: hypothetical protein APR62_06465 [Smithella sp. SDB]|nr:MAG: hypothetical protein APR62_06465 [Smithella sp. SDB]
MSDTTFKNQSQYVADELMLKQPMTRIIFCTYWLYFFGLRYVLGGVRLLDYIGMSLVVLGLMNLMHNRLINWRFVGWVILLMCPMFIAAILDASEYIILFLLKSFLVVLYFTCYFKSMRLTIVELVCFTIPVAVSVYYFLYPRVADEVHLLAGRLTGIDEPNFTSLSLIYALCGAFGIYILRHMKLAKMGALLIATICLFGVVLTASMSGFIGAIIALCCFLVIEKRKSLVIALAAVIIALNLSATYLSNLVVIQRFQDIIFPNATVVNKLYGGRDRLAELAWSSISSGDWFFGGGPQRLNEWGSYISFAVPHNSLLDIGIEFGRASFYFYSAMFVIFLVMNVRTIVRNRQCRNYEEKTAILAAMLFLSLIPMYLSLSTGMAMTFILWMVLGAYPLLHPTPKHTIVQ